MNLEKVINYMFYFSELPDCTLYFNPYYLEENKLFIETMFNIKNKDIANTYFKSAIPGMNIQNFYVPHRMKMGDAKFLQILTHNNKVNFIECDSILDLEIDQKYESKSHNGLICNMSREFCNDKKFSWSNYYNKVNYILTMQEKTYKEE